MKGHSGEEDPTAARGDPGRPALRVDAVDVLPTDLDSFLVRVAGVWGSGATRDGPAPQLVVVDAGEERRFAALPETSGAAEKAAPEAAAFRATFSVPETLGAALAGPLRLAIGAELVDLPPARLPDAPVEPPAGATVVDRAVLAERRARRAELAEEDSARRAREAEQSLRDLEAELAKLEVRLERTADERAALEARVAEHAREARAAAQREFAERHRREEVADDAAARVADAEQAVRDLRGRLREAETHGAELARDAEELRRRAAEAEHAAATAEAERTRAARVAPGGSFAALGEPLAVLRTEAALARRALTVKPALPRDGGREEARRALDVVSEADARVREAAATLSRTAAQLQSEREAHAHAIQSLKADLDREREARTRAEEAIAAERAARARAEEAATEARTRAEESAITERDARAAAEDAVVGERDARTAAEDALAGEREARAALEGQLAAERRARVAAEPSATADADDAELREFVTTAGEALRQAEHRISEAHRSAADLSGRIEELEGALLTERAARIEAEAALPAGEEPSTQAAPSESLEAGPSPEEADAPPAEPAPAEPEEAESAPAEPEEAESAPAEPEVGEPAPAEPDADEPAWPLAPAPAQEPARRVAPSLWLPRALDLMIERDRSDAVQLLLELIAGQALKVDGPLDYRLVVADEGRWTVSLWPGRAAIVPSGDDDPQRPGFQVKTDVRGVLDLLVEGGTRKLRRRVKVGGTWRRRRALRRVPRAVLLPGTLAGAGVWLDPLLLLRALVLLIEPEWTKGHEFVVSHEISGPRGRNLWVHATGAGPVEVLAAPPSTPTTVTVHSSQSAFQRFLGGEADGPERWTIRGDVSAVSVLSDWLERARGRS